MARGRKSQNFYTQERRILWKIAVYIRLSREDGNELNDESDSITNQKKILKEYLEQFFEDEYEIFDYYVDDGLSGTDDSRENFVRMIHDVEQKNVNCIICKTLSRAFRNYSDQGYYLEYFFPRKNIRFISTGDPKIDTYKNPEVITGLEVPITGLMNDRYAAKTSSDVRRTFDTKRRNGEYIGSFPPYGYLKDPENKNKLVIDPDTAPIKRDMLNWIIKDGLSLRGVAFKLNELGILSPAAHKKSLGWNFHTSDRDNKTDGLWTGRAVKAALFPKVNLGHMVQGQSRVISYKVHDKIRTHESEWFVKENTHEPTFTQEEYDTLVSILSRNNRTPNNTGGKLNLFAGYLRCSDCDQALARRNSRNTYYYSCSTYRRKSKEKCSKHTMREDTLIETVLHTIQSQISFIDGIVEMIDKINEVCRVDTKSERIEKSLLEKRREVAKFQSALDALYPDLIAKNLTREDYVRMKSRFTEQIAQLSLAIANLTKEQGATNNGITSEAAIFLAFRKFKNITELDRNILAHLVDTIYVQENKEITVKFKYENEFDYIQEFVELNKNKVNNF